MIRYHEATKHTVASVMYSSHYLDWSNEPSPFRAYPGAPRVALSRLPEPLPGKALATIARLGSSRAGGIEGLCAETLSRLLFHSVAISAWKEVKGTGFRYSLRVNPSSGNLHPNETWLALRGVSGIEDGLWHYDARSHALERRRDGGAVAAVAAAAGDPAIGGCRAVVVLSSIFWREAWKYRDRAFRYCLHDAGHAAASILVAARTLGFRGEVRGAFDDARLTEILAIAADDGERPLLVLPLFESDSGPAVPMGAPLGPALGAPEPARYEWDHPVIAASAATTVSDTVVTRVTTAPDPVVTGRDDGLAAVVRRRRSALDFDPAATMAAADLDALLRHATRPFPSDFGGGLVTLYPFVHAVDGVAPGAYRLDAASGRLDLVVAGDQRRTAAGLSLGQDIAANAVVAFTMAADLARAERLFGPRGYRYALVEAGFIGQLLYVGAEALGFNATGIGAFYDDDVNRFLALDAPATQAVYHFSVGRAVPDPRLVAVADEDDQSSSPESRK